MERIIELGKIDYLKIGKKNKSCYFRNRIKK